MYGASSSPAFSSSITDRVFEESATCRNRPLEKVYGGIYLDAVHYKVRENRKVLTKAVYSVYGVRMDGERDVLGLFIGDAEGARHWARVLENIKDRGVKDVLFFSVDGLNGFSEAIQGVFTRAVVQRCIVHMVRQLEVRLLEGLQDSLPGLRSIRQQDSPEAAWEKPPGVQAGMGREISGDRPSGRKTGAS
ncbi:MAG: transposase [Flavobacteriales bacterium]|nr:transposase [Flavobacteriales bacterium]